MAFFASVTWPIRHHWKTASAVCVILVLFASVPFLWRSLSWHEDLFPADVILVLGGGKWERIFTGIQLYHEHRAPKILISGGTLDKKHRSEAEYMYTIATRAGVDPHDILIENRSQDTYENMIESKKIVETEGWKNIIIVTSNYHQRRSVMTAKKVFGDDYILQSVGTTNAYFDPNNWWSTADYRYFVLSEWLKIGYIFMTQEYQKTFELPFIVPKI